MTQDDVLYRFRLRVFAIAAELGNVRASCRAMGIHPSTYYRWKRQLDRHGPEILRPRERRVPRIANVRDDRGQLWDWDWGELSDTDPVAKMLNIPCG